MSEKIKIKMLQYFLKKSIVTICLNLAILMLGVFAFPKIAREFIPAIDIPAVAVVYPTTVHSLDTIKFELLNPAESLLLKTGVIDRIESFYENGHAVMLLFFSWDLKPEECIQRARQALNSFNPGQGFLKPLFILHRPTMSPIYRISFYGESLESLTQKTKTLSQDLERISGVAQVRTLGGANKNTIFEYKISDLSKNKIDPKSLLEQITQKWSFRSLLFDSSGAHNLSLNIEDSDQYLNLEIPNLQNKLVPLRFFTKKYIETPEPQVLNKFGDATLILEIIKAPGSDAVQLTELVENKISLFLQNNKQINQTIIYNEAEKIVESQAGVFSNFLTGIVLNSLVLMIFLGSLAGVVVASSIFPTTILGTLFILKEFGISLNIFSLNGFSLAAGMITDASTVVLESIIRRFQNGEDIESASLKGTKDILIGVITGTLSSAAVMLPICLQSGVSSKLFSDLGYTLVITQLLSLVTVFTFVPWLCFKMIKKNSKQPRAIEILFSGSSYFVNKFISFSDYVFKKSLKQKTLLYTIPGITAIICVGSLMFLPSSELLPVVKASTYSLSIPFNKVFLNHNQAELRQKMATVLKQEQLIEWAVTNNDSDSLLSTFKAKAGFNLDQLLKKIASEFNVSQSHLLIFPLGPTPPTEPMNYNGYYYLSEIIPLETRTKIIKEFCSTQGISDCEYDKHYQATRISMTNRFIQMQREHTNPLETALQAASQINLINLTQTANLPIQENLVLKTVGEIPLYNSAHLIPTVSKSSQIFISSLGELYDKNIGSEILTKFRVNTVDYAPLYFKLDGITLGTAMNEMQNILKANNIQNQDVKGMGAILNMNETFAKMMTALAISLVLTVLILIFQFKSITQTIIIMLSIPLSLGGAVLGLLILNETVNISVMVGFILLGGIIVNNGILLMESIKQNKEEGLDLKKSIQNAVSSRTRPIIMTSVSAIAGMLPTLLFESEGQELYRGMAIVNIFGMAFGTILTLIVTPLICWIFMRSKNASE